VHAFTCLWYSVTGTKPVTVILIRDKQKTGYDIALVTTEKDPEIGRVIERYAARWAIEVGHRWYRSSCFAFSRLRSFLAGFLASRREARTAVVAGRACPAFAQFS
jgi:hypothetical protein